MSKMLYSTVGTADSFEIPARQCHSSGYTPVSNSPVIVGRANETRLQGETFFEWFAQSRFAGGIVGHALADSQLSGSINSVPQMSP